MEETNYIIDAEFSNMSAELLRVANFVKRTEIYGPGMRSAIWVQGCTLACKGCWNTHMWSKKGGEDRSVIELHEQLMKIEENEGITLLGGEPLQQSEEVLELIKLQKAAGRTVMLYSGYEPEELDSVQQECVDNSDIVILGRYKEELRNTKLRWRGSENQVLYSPTGRYTVEDFPDGETEISVHIDADGKLLITGYPDLEFMMEIMDKITGELL